MHVIYVGDSRNIRKRLKQHQGGNIEASALRKHIAISKGFNIKTTRRKSGSYRRRLDSPDPKQGERELSHYIGSGTWSLALCETYDEAHDLQWFLIEHLRPTLNIDKQKWDATKRSRYEVLQLEMSRPLPLEKTPCPDGPGVYVLYHELLPREHRNS